MNFGQILQMIQVVPAIINTIEQFSGHGGIVLSGAAKKQAVRTAVLGSAAIMEAFNELNVKDRKKFDKGLDKVIDGVVDMLNSSEWKKG